MTFQDFLRVPLEHEAELDEEILVGGALLSTLGDVEDLASSNLSNPVFPH
jgi:hypothetical protein